MFLSKSFQYSLSKVIYQLRTLDEGFKNSKVDVIKNNDEDFTIMKDIVKNHTIFIWYWFFGTGTSTGFSMVHHCSSSGRKEN